MGFIVVSIFVSFLDETFAKIPSLTLSREREREG
jgi:hypothetical protein